MRAPTQITGIRSKFAEMNWLLPVLVFLVGIVGVVMIYSATGGDWSRGGQQHFIRLVAGMVFMFMIALVDIRIWFTLAYPVYIGTLILLIGVEFYGVSVNGAQRWLDIGIVRIQPSELMKMALVLAIARFYHDLPSRRVSQPVGILGALFILVTPVFFVLKQPDLGTSLLLLATGVSMIFLAGLRWRIVLSAIGATIVAVPLIVAFALKDYQKQRIMTFLDPSRDPTGASYHIIQSKIALGSGGVNGKGFLEGSQASLKYVPENRTDFIFTVIGEEFGFIGGMGTMLLYASILALCIWMSMQTKNTFSRLMIMGLTTTFALYVFINMAMVMGIAPVVGVPLPLISYGGTVMLTVLSGFGLILSAYIHRDTKLPHGTGLIL